MPVSLQRLAGKVAIVTGAASGIGHGLVADGGLTLRT